MNSSKTQFLMHAGTQGLHFTIACSALQAGLVLMPDGLVTCATADILRGDLMQYLGDLGCLHIVFKNDEKTVEEIASMNPRGILVSPGPGSMPS